ncbi:carboxymuconolactone decarboxylase family protein [Nonomuraea rhodomycinica]|uniref:Carboxymuconolactone decarboxylase family protein n=1 Tax=Nonomuraea rhodomycinica TaxID=1712872 RepID=A0A7Y6IJB9_9ACTN|nr:carboxymuconolactone decarboxylase family protein [Nonomuraea rhodomycinica]NUW38740.1 carboxymuconolactone decarboxylase family protein [Nonomuraea rhodomycinica]
MPTHFRYVSPTPVEHATGRTARVYEQIAAGFGMRRMPVFMTLSPAPDVLAATWATMRESLLAGDVSRTGREVVALGVSVANRCPFCVGAHTTLLHATGEHRLAETIAAGGTPDDPGHAALLAWATATRTPGAPELSAPPYPRGHAPQYIGTALTFHFINRIASALITEDLLPGGLQRSRLVRSAGGRAMARTVRRRLAPGEGLATLEGLPAGREPGWAAGTPVGRAYATLTAVAAEGETLLSQRARAFVREAVVASDGSHPPLGGWPDLGSLPAGDRPGARLALLAALAPYRVTDADVSAWRESRTVPASPGSTEPTGRTGARTGEAGAAASDEELVRLVAFGAMTATAHAEAAITAATIQAVLD